MRRATYGSPSRAIQTLRFPAREVLTNLDGVVRHILATASLCLPRLES